MSLAATTVQEDANNMRAGPNRTNAAATVYLRGNHSPGRQKESHYAVQDPSAEIFPSSLFPSDAFLCIYLLFFFFILAIFYLFTFFFFLYLTCRIYVYDLYYTDDDRLRTGIGPEAVCLTSNTYIHDVCLPPISYCVRIISIQMYIII